ncbi:cytochrome c [Chryseobacterium polytrichastri]|uniref:Cytochrome c domain-containing protein n=1 Tax=Chryseobacterium polytrichastri TaxID=1302687 RepID=A0A1M6TNC5_9FLAO|nr:cytochrome c [Chryseobacterium polytrichastri]SHK58413.1 hypothetical protein SAMN05444267_1005150 [Chryseobacterium polytrichastri]
MKKVINIVLFSVFLISCDSRTFEQISDTTPINDIVKYTVEVEPIIKERCLGCHSPGGPAAFRPFTNYNQVKEHIDNIIDRIQRPNGAPGRMPPGGALSPSQINTFIQWKSDGLLEN